MNASVWTPYISVLITRSLSAYVWCVHSVDDKILVLGDDAKTVSEVITSLEEEIQANCLWSNVPHMKQYFFLRNRKRKKEPSVVAHVFNPST